MDITLQSSVFREADQLSALVDGELVILDIQLGKYFGLDDIAQAIWDRLSSPVTVGQLCLDLEQRYDAPLATIQHDVLVMLNDLHQHGIVKSAA